MRNFTFKQFNLFKLFFAVLFFLATSQVRAQFPYSESFKGTSASGIQFGGTPSAFLTAPSIDTDGRGYLRLTNNQGNQKGIIYSDQYSFPSAYGMSISFEYYTYGSTNGADGIAFILYDATASAQAGAFGGSLGYAQRNTENGFTLGYLGIGIDEYGNFSANNEGKDGGDGVLPSNITLRGSGSGTGGYKHLKTVQTTALATPFNVAGKNRLATISTNPDFRKIQIDLKPIPTGGFLITVSLTYGNVTVKVIDSFSYSTPPPANLKFAISSSTGGSTNNHEIRNLNITVDPATLLTPIAVDDTFSGCIGSPATSSDITANDNGAVNTKGTINKSTIDLDPATAGIQTSYTSVGNGTFAYDSSTGKVTFTPLNNTVVGPVVINYTFNDSYNKTSKSATITYNTYAAITNNTITPATSTFCDNTARSTVITGAAATDGKGSGISYRWESSSNNVAFSTISGATKQNYTTPSINTTMYYRRIASTPTCSNISNVAAVIYGGASAPSATGATAITCDGFTANWNAVSNATSYGLSLSTFSDFRSQINPYDGRDLKSAATSFTINGLTTGTTYYYKVWAFNACGTGAVPSDVITVKVGSGSVPGIVSSAQTICSGTSPQDLTLNGYTGTIQWQKSTDNSNFTNIGFTAATLTSAQMGNLTVDTYYRAAVSSGVCAATNSASVLIRITPNPTLGSALQSGTTCAGSNALINLTGLLPGSISTITYSIDGILQTPVTGVEADPSGKGSFNSATLNASNNGEKLRIISVTNIKNTPNCTSTVNVDVTLSVDAISVGGTIASVPGICTGTSPADLVLSGNLGSVIRWEKSTVSDFSSARSNIIITSTTLKSSDIGNLTANTYFRAAVQNGVCFAVYSDPILVTVNDKPNAGNLSGNQNICIGGATTFTSNGTAGGTWKSSNTSIVTVDSAGKIAGIAAGTANITYTVTTGGCASESVRTVSVNALPVAASLSTNSPVCSGSNAIFTITGTSGNTVTYTGAASGTATIGSGGTVNVTVSNVSSNTTLNLTNVSDGTCNRALTATATVSVNALPVAASLSTNSPVCSGSNAIFTITGTSGNTVTYTGAASGTATIGSGGTVNVTVSNVSSNTTLNLTNVSDGTCNRALTATATVSVNALPVAASLSTNSPVCSGSNAIFTITGTSGNTVTYTGAASGTATIGSGGTVNVTVSNVSSNTTLNLTNVSDGTCNRALTATATVSVNALPVAASLSTNSPVCSGSNAIFTITGTSGNTVTYTGAASGTATIGSGGTVNVTVSNVSSNTTLNLTNVSDGTCNRALTATATVSVNALPVAASLSTNSPVCSGSNAIFTITGTSGNTVTYTGAASGTATIGSGGTVNVTVSNVSSNTTLNLTNVSDGTCNRALTATATVSVNALPVAASLSTNSPVCSGSNAIFTITGTSGNTVTYTGAASGTATIGSGGTVNVTVSNVSSNTTLNLTNVSDGTCNRALTATATVSVNALPVAASLSTNSPVCSGSNAIFTITGTSGNTVTYTGAASGTATIGSGGTVNVTVSNVSSNTTLNLTNVSDGTCNRALTATATVSVNALPVAASLSTNSPVCSGSNAIFTITGTSGNTVTYTGAASGTATIGSGGTVNVTVSNVSSNTTLNLTNVSDGTCNRALTATATVSVNALPVAASLSTNSPVCSGSNAIFTITGTSGNTVTYTGAASGTATIGSGGTVNVTVSNVSSNTTLNLTNVSDGTCNRALTATATVSVNALPVAASLSTNSPVCSGSNAIFTITGTSGNTVTYTGAASGTATIGSGGTVNVTVSNVSSNTTLNLTNVSDGTCNRALTATATVSVNALPVAASLSTNSPVCSGSNAIFTITGTSGNTVTYTGAASGTATIGSGGTVNVTVSNVSSNTTLNLTNVSDGTCNRALTATATVSVNALPVAASLSTNSPVCSGSNAIFTITGTSGNTVTYTGAASGTATIGSGGTVNVTVSNVSSNTTLNLTNVSDGTCNRALTATATVSVNALPVAASLSTNSPVCSGSNAIFTITGTSGNTVTYTGAASGTATIGSGGTVNVTVSNVSSNTTLNLTNVSDGTCNRALTATATVSVNALPVAASLSTNSPVCSGSNAIFTITGTSGNTVTYTGAASGTATIGSGGTVNVTVSNVSSNTTLNLTNVSDGTCNRALTATATVSVNALPVAASLSTNSPVCSGSNAIFTITGTSGNTVTYTGAASGTATIGSGGTVNVTVSNVSSNTTLNLTNVSDGTCNRALTATATVSVNALPVAASLSTNSPVCSGSNAIFTITGTSGNTVTYTGAASGTATIGSGGTVNVTVSNVSSNTTLNLTNVSDGTCNRALTATATVTVNALPTTPAITLINQLTCTVSTGSFTISNYDSSYAYDITPAGASLNKVTGVVTAEVGTYYLTATLGNCTSEVSSIIINSKICANDDSYTATPGTTVVTTVGNVTANDKLNGVDVTALNTTVTAITTGPLSIDASGVLTLDPNTVSGTYTITYQICEKEASPDNCKTATATVVVKGTLVANDDSYTAIPGTTVATTVGNVTANDKLNGEDVTALNTAVTPKTTGPLSIDASGVLTLDPNTVSGTYTITYQICEKEASPDNCKTATATVVVKGTLVANDDSYTAIPGTTVATTVGNVTANDKLNGEDVTALNTAVTPKTTGPLSIDASGVLTLDPNTVSGTYTITYQICEKEASPDNCKTATATVVVKGTLVANDDSYTAIPGTTVATTVGNVTANDKLNGEDVTALNTAVTPKTTGPLSIDASGVLTLDPNTVSGTYTITYQICEKEASPDNCKTATVTVVVKGTLVANDDSYTAIPGTTVATTVGNVTANDKLNGEDVTALNTAVTPKTTGPLSIDASGVLTLDPNTVSGTYTITYQICEKEASPDNCKTATATVVVKGTLVANDDSYTAIPGTTVATTVGNVTANDKLNGEDVTALNTAVTPKTTGPLSIDASGVLTLDPNTVSGTYTITYQICEKEASPDNCKTATATVVVKGTLVANDDSYTAIPGTTVATTVGNVTANDKLNGEDVTALNTAVTPKTTGPLSIDASGVLTLDPNTVSGTYTITYQICEKEASPDNCKTATVTVVVKGTLVANDDSYTAIPGTTVATTVGNVTANDKLNGEDVTALNTAVTPKTTGPLSIDASGVLTLDPNTVSGTYTITYQICEKEASPDNCKTATVTVVVKGTLVANDDSYTAIPGTTVATTVGNVTANDKLNGEDVTALNTAVTPKTTGPLSIDASGVLTLDPNTVSGTYTITYQICEKEASPDNCKTATATVVVKGTLVANDDSYTAIPGTTVATTVGNVTANDKLNGEDVTALNTAVTPKTTGPLSIDASGVLTLDPNTVSGTYTITYQICEKEASPDNCKTATATVVVKGTLVANDDSYTAIPGTTVATTVGNVTANDKLNGEDVTALNTAVTPKTTGPLSIDASGVLTLDPNTVSGTYTITYQICEKEASPDNCKTATVTVVVKGTLVANDDSYTAIPGTTVATTVGNVTANDKLNGEDVTALNTAVTPKTTGPLSIDASGVLTLDPNTVSGTYTITYQICEKEASPDNCKTATATVVVKGTLVANDDSYTAIPGTTVATTVGNVTANDKLNGEDVTALNTAVTPKTTGPLSIDASGVLTLDPNTVSGTYTITYQICEKEASPDNCKTATVTVVVKGTLVANDDSYTAIPGTTVATTVGNVTANDKLNGEDVTALNTAVTPKTTGPLSIDASGVLTLDPNTVSGTYTITYQICEKEASPDNCKTATATVVVKGTLVANDDSYTAIPGTTVATTVGNVTANDKLNGEDVTALNTAVTPKTTGPLSIDASGVLTLDPNTVSGTYTITYQICEKEASPDNCKTATVTVVVKGTLVANDDSYTAIPGTTVATTVGNVTANDKLNGEDVTALNTAVTPKTTGPLSIDASGVLTLDPNTVSGTYTITYQICEKEASPDNCKTATVTVVVKGTLVANDDSYTAIPGTTVATTVGNVTANDKLNGEDVTALNTAVTPKTTGPLSIDASGVLTLDPNTVSGTYTITYQICEKEASPDNCKTATVTVVVKGTLVANDDSYTAIPGTTVATTVGNVTANDKLNGEDVTALNTAVTPKTTGPLSIDASGVLTLDPNTVSGTYTITYQICEKEASPDNCKTATVTVVVKGTLVANDDSYTATPGTTVATTVGNVTVNDKLNGVDVTALNTAVTPKTTGPLSIDASGVLTLDPNTVSGTYTITYQICEKGANPVNCDTAEATVVVKGTLVANDDSYTATPRTTVATTVGNVTVNDKLNGVDVTALNTAVTPKTTGPLSIDASGVLTLDPNTVSGTYTITYQICEKGANPVNCDTAEATVVVKGTLVANDDSYTATPGTTVATTVGNVTVNDKLNGVDVTALNTAVTPKTTGPLSIDASGVLTLDPNTVSGTYTITYQICEKGANPVNCDTAEATVVVKGTLVANDDSYTATPGTTVATTVGNVTVNDKLNGVDVTALNTAVTPKTTGPLSIDASGVLTLDPNTVSGTYTITYQICEKGANPVNCDTAEATVVVKGTLVANDDSYTATPGTTVATTVGNVTVNDKLNGVDVTALNTAVTPKTTGPLSIDASGVLTLDPNTVSGTYTITYQICEKGANPVNCDTAEATVVVKGSLDAKDDNTYLVQVPDATVVITVGNVKSNDTLNGKEVTATNTIVTPISSGPLKIDADGVLTLEPNTVSGSYTITYEICEKGANPANCDSATVTVVVGKGVIKALTENTLPVNGSTGGKTVSLIDNVTLNGNSAVIKNSNGGIILTVVKVPTGLTLNPDGTVTVKPGTPVGNYEIEYTICEYLNPDNCVTVKSYVPVISGSLQANNDNAGTIDTSKGQSSTTSIFDNDTLNGSAVKPADVILTTIVSNPNLILKADGTIEVKSGTPTGNYELTYRICEALNASNCSQAVAKISVVNNPPVTPLIQLIINNDGPVNVDGINGSLEFINVFDNDLLKGLPINPIDVILNAPQNAYFEFNQDGTVNVKPNTPGGNYTMTYQVCEKANPTNCASATLSVFVEAPAIAIIKTAVFNDENNNKVADAGETITYKFKVTNTGNVPLVGVTVLDPLPGVAVSGQAINLGVNESDEYNFTATYKITQSDINKGSVSNQASVQARSNKGVLVDDLSDDDNNTGDQPTVLDLTSCVIKVFNAFSPNGDEKNKRFYIQGLECYPDNTVEIYNRWGILVYDVDNYNNEDRAFVGYSQGRTTVKQSEGLPEGTYFYILKYKDSGSNSRQLSGYLYINK